MLCPVAVFTGSSHTNVYYQECVSSDVYFVSADSDKDSDNQGCTVLGLHDIF